MFSSNEIELFSLFCLYIYIAYISKQVLECVIEFRDYISGEKKFDNQLQQH